MSRNSSNTSAKTISKSEQARMQPRDNLGRFSEKDLKDSKIIVIDEFGNTGNSMEKERRFGFGVSVVNNPESFIRISQKLREKHNTEEYKANKATIPERVDISKKIHKTGTDCYSCYINKDADMPQGFRSDKKYSRIDGMLGYTLDKTLPKKGNIFVMIDYNNQYKGRTKVESICKSRSNDNRTVRGTYFNSVGDGKFSDLIQTHDYVSNAARSNLELNEPARSTILKMKFIRATKDDEFDKNDVMAASGGW